MRANDPAAPRAVWLKATVLTKADGTSVAEAWCSVFDGNRTAALRRTIPLEDAGIDLTEDAGTLRGELASAGARVAGTCRSSAGPGRSVRPMSLFPSARLVDAPFPKNKLLTPFPSRRLLRRPDLGRRHVGPRAAGSACRATTGARRTRPEYAWGQCVFPDRTPWPRVRRADRLGRRTSPLFSMLVVRRGDQEYRFDRILDRWRQQPLLDFPRWTLEMRGRGGRARWR